MNEATNIISLCEKADRALGDGPINLRKFHRASALYLAILSGVRWLLKHGYRNFARDLRDFLDEELAS